MTDVSVGSGSSAAAPPVIDTRGGFSGPAGFTTRPVIRGFHGVVAAGHYAAAEIGMRVLEAGGNAIDAGVASVFALTLLKPQSAGIGGECPILVYHHSPDPSLPNPVAISGQGVAPRRATIEWFREQGIDAIPGDGLLATTVPATFDACVVALQRFGRLGLRETLGPVVDLAPKGSPCTRRCSGALSVRADRYRDEYPTTGEVYLHRGDVPGARLAAAEAGVVVDLPADRRRRDRRAAPRRGPGRCARGGARPLLPRLRGRRDRGVRRLDARGRRDRARMDGLDRGRRPRRVSDPPRDAPSRSGTAASTSTNAARGRRGPSSCSSCGCSRGSTFRRLGHNSADYLHTLVEAAKLAFADRERWYGDPRFADVPLERLLSDGYAAERRGLIDAGAASGEFRPGDVGPVALPSVTPDPRAGNGDTTHVDVADEQGNLFAATPSGGWLESSPVIPALGFPLGSRLQVFNLDPSHPNSLAPGKRPRTTLTPSLATRDGQPWMAFGTPGGDQQDQWTLQFFLNVVDFGMDLQAAIDAPLVHTLALPVVVLPARVLPPKVGRREPHRRRRPGRPSRRGVMTCRRSATGRAAKSPPCASTPRPG